MKITLSLLMVILLFVLARPVTSQEKPATKPKPVWLILKSKDVVKGDLVIVTPEEVQFKVKNILQVVPLEDVAVIHFTPPPPGYTAKLQAAALATPTPSPTPENIGTVLPMSESQRPTIQYRERARYTEEARHKGIQGTVVLSVVYTWDGRITDIRVVRGLPSGLSESAIEAAKKIRFTPAKKDGQPVSVRGNIEFNFTLYDQEHYFPPSISPANGAVFSNVPRTLELQWGELTYVAKYKVEIEYGSQNEKEWSRGMVTETANTKLSFEFWGAQPGRWRVWAVFQDGKEGAKSPWYHFRFTQ